MVEVKEELAPTKQEYFQSREPVMEEPEVTAPAEEPESTKLTEKHLLSLRNSDLRNIIVELDPEANAGNKSKKKLVSMVLEMQNDQ